MTFAEISTSTSHRILTSHRCTSAHWTYFGHRRRKTSSTLSCCNMYLIVFVRTFRSAALHPGGCTSGPSAGIVLHFASILTPLRWALFQTRKVADSFPHHGTILHRRHVTSRSIYLPLLAPHASASFRPLQAAAAAPRLPRRREPMLRSARPAHRAGAARSPAAPRASAPRTISTRPVAASAVPRRNYAASFVPISSKVPVTLAEGDGIGPEISSAVVHILKEAGAAVRSVWSCCSIASS